MNEHSFTLVEIAGYLTTLHLVRYGDRAFLLDGGCRRDSERVHAFLDDNRIPADQLELVCVSHMHPDHAGSAGRMRQKLGVNVTAPHLADRWYRGLAGATQHKVDILLAQYSAWRNGRKLECVFYPRRLRPDILLADGDPLPGFPDWTAIAIPGHTAHDMGFYHRNSGTLYAGDITIRRNNRYLLPFPVPFPDRMRDSLLRLQTLPVRTLLLAHGGTIRLPKNHTIFADLIHKLDEPQPEQFRKLAPLCRIAPDIRKPGKHSS